MNNIWTIAAYELRRLFRSRSLLLNQFLLPLVLIFLLGSALSGVVGEAGDSPVDPVKVGVVNTAGSGLPASEMMEQFLASQALKETVLVKQTDSRAEAEKGVRSGKFDYAVIVPQGFDESVHAGKRGEMEFIPGKDRTNNLVAEAVFDGFLSRVNYTQAAAITLGPEAAAASAQASVNEEGTSVKLGKLNEEGKAYSSSQFYGVSMLLMFLLYCGLTVSTSLFNEKVSRTLQRISAMPVKGSDLFLGKLIGVGLVSILQCASIVLLSHWLLGIDWGDRPLVLAAFCLLMIVASMMLAIVVSMFTKTNSAANTVISTLTVIMTFISGGMAPLPESWTNSVGQFTINHWAMDAMLRMMLHEGLDHILPNLLVLCVICVVLMGAAVISYRKVGYTYE